MTRLGDGLCHLDANNKECGFDDGDCIYFNILYKNCYVFEPYRMGDGYCNLDYNTSECHWDGGDCLDTNEFHQSFPNCYTTEPFKLGNGICDNTPEFNQIDCGWDFGDCIGVYHRKKFHSLYLLSFVLIINVNN